MENLQIIKTILNKIKIHKSCYLVLFLAFLMGEFHAVFFCSVFLLVHECGHFFTALLFGWETDSITFYPFGGVSKFMSDVNCPIYQEALVLMMGPITQCVLFLFLKALSFPSYQAFLFKQIHYSLLFFNLLPFYPLDGGRILQVFSCYFLSYQKSYTFILTVSYSILILLLLLLFFLPSIFLLLLFFLLLFRFLSEKKNIKYYKERFFLERYLKKYPFKKRKIVKNEKDFFRSYNHIIKKGTWYQTEEEYLKQKYK